jgi:ABC-type antimicrobial peptide transport system permease subunit
LTVGSAEATQQSATSSTDIYVIAAAIAVIIAVIAAAIAILRKLK